jgi:LCP family protein required for cell wall assembly
VLVADLAVFGLALQAAQLLRPVHRPSVELPSSPGTSTWLLIGTDDRAEVPERADPAAFGTTAGVRGSRADVVVVLHRTSDGVAALSVPRDLLVVDGQGRLARVAIALEAGGLQSVVDGLCRSLSIPIDHIVQVDFAGFAAAVDALGGIDIELDRPIRDAHTGLDQPDAGRARFDGVAALAYVRSRHAEELVDGRWQPESDGAVGRARRILEVLQALGAARRHHRWDLLTQRRLALALAPHLTVDRGTSALDLVRLRMPSGDLRVLPTRRIGASLSRAPNEATTAALADAGFGAPCVPGPSR